MRAARLLAASAIAALLAMAIFGAAYPLATLAAGRAAFPWQSAGSPLVLNGEAVGSELLAQRVNSSKLFHPISEDDPYVPLNYALAQIPRISNATGIPEGALHKLVLENAEQVSYADLYVFGPGYEIVNTAELNYELVRDYPWAYGEVG